MSDEILNNETSFYNFCKYDYVNVVIELLKSKYVDVNHTKIESNKTVKNDDNEEEEEEEEDDEFNIDKNDEMTPLLVAIKKGNIEIVKVLTNDLKIDINRKRQFQ